MFERRFLQYYYNNEKITRRIKNDGRKQSTKKGVYRVADPHIL